MVMVGPDSAIVAQQLEINNNSVDFVRIINIIFMRCRWSTGSNGEVQKKMGKRIVNVVMCTRNANDPWIELNE